eukprot:10250882-Alexandrium_andersonii.AAC.1
MSASLVGSEMCIRDRSKRTEPDRRHRERSQAEGGERGRAALSRVSQRKGCLLYTSDAADDM